DGIQHLFPDYFEEFVAPIPAAERSDLMHAYYRRLTSSDLRVRRAAAEPWSLFEARCSSLLPSQAIVEHFSDPDMAMAIARIECHYFVNDCFLAPDQIIRAAARLRDIPGVIVQGRYDVVCPAVSAWRLHQVWPQAKFVLVPDAGHASSEPGICAALVEATDVYARRLAAP
ncbi:MAG: alpha/beta hydrolase, partial [Rhizomicrobium sp.]